MSGNGVVASLMGGEDNSVEAMGKLWGTREYQRRTFGNPDRTRAMTLLHALADPLAATQADSRAVPAQIELTLPYLKDLAEGMAASWAGEGGWDTDRLVKAIGAAKAQNTFIKPIEGRDPTQ
ncbi:MAG: hypothetical protein LC620_00395 [Halobacteriales archaeon]|nr:hypothetical protein [Halobacteriales archaeon]